MSEEIEVTLPKLGESIVSATVVKWFKREGEPIVKDEPLLEVATDKVNSEIPSPASGIVKAIRAKPDQELDVGGLLAIISTAEGPPSAPGQKGEKLAQSTPSPGEMKDYYSPAVLRMAREKEIPFEELEKVQGTGAGGRISKRDLESYISRRRTHCPLETPEATTPEEVGIEKIKMSGMRKTIADNMVRSFYKAPHATLVVEVDVTRVVKVIEQERDPLFQKQGIKLTITPFIARAITHTLGQYPLLNASLEKETIVVKQFVNLGVAVSIDQGVMVPVIKGCQNLSLIEIAKAIGTLAKKARGGTLSPDDVREGTVTMTNFGMSGILIGIPIIRYPEVAIAGVGGITKRVVPLDNDLLGIRQIVHISLTFDHRVIDGMYGCEFLAAVKKHLEEDLKIDT